VKDECLEFHEARYRVSAARPAVPVHLGGALSVAWAATPVRLREASSHTQFITFGHPAKDAASARLLRLLPPGPKRSSTFSVSVGTEHNAHFQVLLEFFQRKFDGDRAACGRRSLRCRHPETTEHAVNSKIIHI
jgi:hypothetical protein